MKKVLKFKTFFGEYNYGVVGEPTPIKDKNGEQLKVGDLVFLEYENTNDKESFKMYMVEPVVKPDNESYFVNGLKDAFYPDGTYSEKLVLTKVKDCEEIHIGDITAIEKDSRMEYCEEVENEEKEPLKEKITLKEFWESKASLAIHCDTKRKAKKLLKAFNKMGERWRSGYSYLEIDNYNEYKENTIYANDNGYDDFEQSYNYDKIYKFEDVIFED